jgi:hypothetical protein
MGVGISNSTVGYSRKVIDTKLSNLFSTFLSLSGGTLSDKLGIKNAPFYFDLDTASLGNSYGDLGLGSSSNILINPNSNLILTQNIGNVGIGTGNGIPNEKLTVVGNISATGVVYASTGNSTNWQNTSTFVQNNSGEFALSLNDYSIDTNLPTVEQSFLLGGLFLKKIPIPKYIVRNYNNTTTTFSGTGTSYAGNLAIFSEYNHLGNSYLSFNNLNYLDGAITITTFNLTNGLTAINFPNLKGVTSTYTINVLTQRVCSYPGLEYVGGGLIIGTGNPFLFAEDLQAISFPNLQFIGGYLTIGGYGNTKAPILSSVSFPSLKIINGFLNLGGSTGLGAASNRPLSNLTTIDFTNLEICNGIQYVNIPNLTVLTFPNLKMIRGGTTFVSCTALREVSFPNVEIIGGYSSANGNVNTPSLTSISFPNLIIYTTPRLAEFGTTASLRNFEFGTNTLKQVAAPVINVAQTLTQQSVDNLLKAFANLDGTNGTTAYTGGSLNFAGSNSAPSYTGGVSTTTAGTNFVRTGTTVVASVVGHNHTTSDIVTFTGNGQSILNGTYVVTVNNANEFQYTTPTSGNLTGSGTVTMRRTTVGTDGFRYFQTIALRNNTVTINFP